MWKLFPCLYKYGFLLFTVLTIDNYHIITQIFSRSQNKIYFYEQVNSLCNLQRYCHMAFIYFFPWKESINLYLELACFFLLVCFFWLTHIMSPFLSSLMPWPHPEMWKLVISCWLSWVKSNWLTLALPPLPHLPTPLLEHLTGQYTQHNKTQQNKIF